MNRDDEIAAIERFVMERGAKICPVVFVAPTSTNFSMAEEARRLSGVPVEQKLTHEQITARMRKFYRTLRP